VKHAMDTATEARLLKAAEDVAAAIADGDTPTDALAKVAKQANLQPGHIQLLANAVNTGTTTRLREDGRDATEKSSDFTLADATKAAELVYPSQVATPATVKRAHSLSSEYLAPPTWYTRHATTETVKTAAALLDLTAPRGAPVRPVDADRHTARLLQANAQDAQTVKAACQQVAAEQYQLDTKLAALTEYFRAPTSLAPADIYANVTTLYGNAGVAVLERVAEHAEHLQKRAATRPQHAVNRHAAPYALIEQILDHGYHVIAYTKAAAALMEQADQLKQQRLTHLKNVVAPPAPQAKSLLTDFEDDEPDQDSKQASMGGLTRAFTNGLAYAGANHTLGALGNEVRDEHMRDEDKLVAQLSSPTHEAKLRQIAVNAQLQDMMANDDIIRAHDPLQVTDAFNQLSSFAPRMTSQPLLMRSLLRRSLQQNVDPFELGELSKMEYSAKRLAQPDERPSSLEKTAPKPAELFNSEKPQKPQNDKTDKKTDKK